MHVVERHLAEALRDLLPLARRMLALQGGMISARKDPRIQRAVELLIATGHMEPEAVEAVEESQR